MMRNHRASPLRSTEASSPSPPSPPRLRGRHAGRHERPRTLGIRASQRPPGFVPGAVRMAGRAGRCAAVAARRRVDRRDASLGPAQSEPARFVGRGAGSSPAPLASMTPILRRPPKYAVAPEASLRAHGYQPALVEAVRFRQIQYEAHVFTVPSSARSVAESGAPSSRPPRRAASSSFGSIAATSRTKAAAAAATASTSTSRRS